ncbi:MAG: hypothetical protein KatS3mg111_1980 [Pirellulaceae bacterium]|nr:MAG: hypothetical protein KatS3mg111_1980 [Pirellulaceae bacterium]
MEGFDQNNQRSSIEQQIQHKMEELAELFAQQQLGADGPGKELTFREIEELGYQLCQLTAQEFKSAVTKGKHGNEGSS